QADGAEEGKGCAVDAEPRHDDRGPQWQLGSLHHSMTSPRMRNLASAELLANPTTAMINAASKNNGVPVRIPNATMRSMALAYSESRPPTRSCARGPRSSLKVEKSMANPNSVCAMVRAQPRIRTFIRRSPNVTVPSLGPECGRG